MPLRSASDSHLQVIGKITQFVQLGDFHVRAHFGFVDNLALLLRIGTSCIGIFVKEEFQMESCIVPVCFRPVTGISE